MEDQDKLPKHPAWKQALDDLLVSGMLKPNAVISHEWLFEHFSIRKPETIQEYQAAQLEFLRQFTELREALLERHNVMLRSVQGDGYEAISPNKQTARAVKDRMRAIRKECRNLMSELAYIDHTALTAAQLAENRDALAKAGTLSLMLENGRKRFSVRDDDERKLLDD